MPDPVEKQHLVTMNSKAREAELTRNVVVWMTVGARAKRVESAAKTDALVVQATRRAAERTAVALPVASEASSVAMVPAAAVAERLQSH